jgi:Fibronectin type III domain.
MRLKFQALSFTRRAPLSTILFPSIYNFSCNLTLVLFSLLRYRAVDLPEWRTLKIRSRDTSEAIITNLSPGREYELMVLSQDQHGDGMFSKSIKVVTKSTNSMDAEQFRSPAGSFVQIGRMRRWVILVYIFLCTRIGEDVSTPSYSQNSKLKINFDLVVT